jgi:hypothetical protein
MALKRDYGDHFGFYTRLKERFLLRQTYKLFVQSFPVQWIATGIPVCGECEGLASTSIAWFWRFSNLCLLESGAVRHAVILPDAFNLQDFRML